jgi:hypothetical protein
MKSFAAAVFTASSLAVAALGPVPPAYAAPSGPGSAQNTLDTLKANGFHVVVNRVGPASLDQCTVTSIRKAIPVTVSADPKVVRTTVYVDLRC